MELCQEKLGELNMIKFDVWKDGKNKCVTMSYDDGVIYDKKLIEIFDKYGFKGTFHINSGLAGEPRIPMPEISGVYKNHEVAVHGVKHESLTKLPPQNVIWDIFEDRKALEALTRKPVMGMSYANGYASEEICSYLKACGILYSRTVKSTKRFDLPENFLLWHPTCHHNEAPELCDPFLQNTYNKGLIFYIWGHSHEFNREGNWDLIEGVCRKLGGRDDIWYASNIEIYDYVTAQRSLRISADNKIIENPSALDVWVRNDEDIVKIPGGETVCF